MTEMIALDLEELRQHTGAAAVILWESAASEDSAFVVAMAPAGLVPLGSPWPPLVPATSLLESDPSRLSVLLPVALRLALAAPATHVWVRALPGTPLRVSLVWSQPPRSEVESSLAVIIDERIRAHAVDFSARERLSLENARMQTVLRMLDQAIVAIDDLRGEAVTNLAGQRLLGLLSSSVPATVVSDALQRLQSAALNQDDVAEVARLLVQQPRATVTNVVWRFDDVPTHLRVTTAPIDEAGASGRIWVFDDISVQMAALAATEEARAEYRLLAENAADIVFRGSLDGTLEWVSESVTATLGWTSTEMIGRSLGELVHPDDRDLIWQEARRAVETAGTGDRLSYRARFARKDGTHRWLEVTARAVLDESGEVVARIGSARDVHVQVETQRALELSETRLRASSDGMLDPQVLLAAVRDGTGAIVDFTYLEVNRATTEYLSMSRDTLIGMSLLEASPGVRETGLFDLYVRAMEGDAPVVVDDFLYDNELLGLVRRYDVRASRVGDELTLTWRDTTDRFEAQERIAQSEEHFRLLAENSADVVLLAREGRVEWVSPSLTRTLGWRPDEWLGQRFMDYLHADDLELATATQAAIDAGETRVLRLRVRAESGRFRWTEIHADPYVDTAGRQDGIIASFRTIDAEVAAEAAVERMARFDALTGLANRNEALRRFAGRQSGARQPGEATAVLFCDVDRFKSINDTLGHSAGDEALRVLAERVRACVRSDDICARMGGDELLVILDGVHGLEDALEVAEKIRQAAERPIPVGEAEVATSLSIGVALARPGEEFDSIMARADVAMYEAKKSGRNHVVSIG